MSTHHNPERGRPARSGPVGVAGGATTALACRPPRVGRVCPQRAAEPCERPGGALRTDAPYQTACGDFRAEYWNRP